MAHEGNERQSEEDEMNRTVLLVACMLGLTSAGCAATGDCTFLCMGPQGMEEHGPYSDMTEEECEDQWSDEKDELEGSNKLCSREWKAD